jgi:hypothetical protein
MFIEIISKLLIKITNNFRAHFIRYEESTYTIFLVFNVQETIPDEVISTLQEMMGVLLDDGVSVFYARKLSVGK